jgi:hypothetical protein
MQEVQAALGVKRGIATKAPAPARFEELHASGLVSEKVINDHAKDMRSPRTSRQLYNAIGSAKELTEATLRAALDRLGESYGRGDDLPGLMKKTRKAIGKVAPPDPHGEAALDKAQTALANLVTFLAEWRNAYGRGHGQPQYPPDLTARHARLAADAAETSVRFIVTTMDDLQLLPQAHARAPPSHPGRMRTRLAERASNRAHQRDSGRPKASAASRSEANPPRCTASSLDRPPGSGTPTAAPRPDLFFSTGSAGPAATSRSPLSSGVAVMGTLGRRFDLLWLTTVR